MEELKSVVSCLPTPKPVSPDLRAQDMKLRLHYNNVYIVCGVVIENDKVLMIQEAKPSCRDKWYLPAGRMEENETIVEAVKREVLEESGLEFEPEALIAVECGSYSWVRFTLAGRITGGSLKTPAEADRESIQAGWFSVKKLQYEVRLRAYDVLPLVELAAKWYRQPQRPFTGLPAQVGHVSASLRLIAVHDDSSHVHVLLRKTPSGNTSLPACLMGLIDSSVHKTLEECGYTGEVKIAGVLQMEHLGKPCGVYDGICLSVVVQAKSRELGGGADWQWVSVEDQACAERLRTAVRNDFGCAKLIDLH